MRLMPLILGMAFIAAASVVAQGQAPVSSLVLRQLKWLFPEATSFSAKGGDPPHIKAFKGDPKLPQSLNGFAFWTTDIQPRERGYDGPIQIVVGMNTKGVISGIIVGQHHEPYGSFSIDRDEFANQFEGKSIRDPFRLGHDIDAVSRATITMTSAVRAIRNSSRRIANHFLLPPGANKE